MFQDYQCRLEDLIPVTTTTTTLVARPTTSTTSTTEALPYQWSNERTFAFQPNACNDPYQPYPFTILIGNPHDIAFGFIGSLANGTDIEYMEVVRVTHEDGLLPLHGSQELVGNTILHVLDNTHFVEGNIGFTRFLPNHTTLNAYVYFRIKFVGYTRLSDECILHLKFNDCSGEIPIPTNTTTTTITITTTTQYVGPSTTTTTANPAIPTTTTTTSTTSTTTTTLRETPPIIVTTTTTTVVGQTTTTTSTTAPPCSISINVVSNLSVPVEFELISASLIKNDNPDQYELTIQYKVWMATTFAECQNGLIEFAIYKEDGTYLTTVTHEFTTESPNIWHKPVEVITDVFIFDPFLFHLNVVNGTGDGNYKEGRIIAIAAIEPNGQYFDSWTDPDGVLDNVNDATPNATMPADDIIVTANFLPYLTLTVNDGTISIP